MGTNSNNKEKTEKIEKTKIKEDVKFVSTYTLNSKRYKEFSLGYVATRKFLLIDFIILIILSLLLLYLKSYSTIITVGIISIILILFIRLLTRNRSSYKVTKDLNNGTDLKVSVTINNEKIIMNSDNGNVSNYTFNQIIYLIETTNLIILKFKHNMGIIIDKSTLTGGTKEELVNHLFSVCENIKKKKLVQAKKWIILRRCSFVFLLIILVLSIILNTYENQKMNRYLEILNDYNYEIEEKTVQRGGKDLIDIEIQDDQYHFYAELMEFDSNESAEDTIDYWLNYNSNEYTSETGKNYERYYFEESNDLFIRKDNIILNVQIYSYEDNVLNTFIDIIDNEILVNE